MNRLLLAEQSKNIVDEVVVNLDKRWTVTVCSDCISTAKSIQECCPDALAINADLSLGDIVSILQDCFPNLPSLIIVYGIKSSTFLDLRFSRWGVDHILESIDNNSAFYSIMSNPEVFRKITIRRAIEHLRFLGFRSGLIGYHYLLLAISYKSEDMTRQLHGETYHYISKITNANEEGIERAIRSAIDSAWKQRTNHVWEKYFPVKEDGSMKCPNISDFVAAIARRV